MSNKARCAAGLTVWFCCFCLIFPVLVSGQSVQVYRLPVAGCINAVTFGDVDRDSTADIITACVTDQHPGQRLLQIFISSSASLSGEAVPIEFEAKPSYVYFSVSDIDNDGGAEIIFFSRHSIDIYSLNAAATCLICIQTIECRFPFIPDTAGFFPAANIIDIDNDMLPEIFGMTPDGFFIYSQDNAGQYRLRIKITCRHAVNANAGAGDAYQYFIPDIHAEDINGDGSRDLILLYPENAHIFFNMNSMYSVVQELSPDTTVWTGLSSTDACMTNRTQRSRTVLHDMNGDTLPDIVSIRTVQNPPVRKRSEVFVYINTNGVFSSEPSCILAAEGYNSDALFSDLNLDSCMDVVMYRFPFNVIQIPRYILNRRSERQFNVYRFNSTGCAGPGPDQIINSIHSIDPLDPQTFQMRFCCSADVTNDGFPDLAVLWADNILEVYENDTAGGFEFAPAYSAAVQFCTHMHMEDITGDGVSDVVMWDGDKLLVADIYGELPGE